MNKFYQAAEDLKKEGKRLKGLMDFADELEKLGSFEQVTKELEAKHQKMKAASDQMEAKLKAMESEANEKAGAMAKVVAEANEKAKGMIASAQGQIVDLKIKAEKECAALVAKAKDEVSLLDRLVDEKHIELDQLKEKVQEEKANLAAIKEQMNHIKKLVGV